MAPSEGMLVIEKAVSTGFSSALLLCALTISPDARALTFSGFEWDLKDSGGALVGPGPNVFSASNVFVDPQGRLHMLIRRINGIWTSSELIMRESIGYGTYRMVLATPIDNFHQQSVLGFFTWDNTDVPANNEMDVEIARFGNTGQNLFHSLQPSSRGYSVGGGAWARSEHTFVWSPGRVDFSSVPLGFGGSRVTTVFTTGVPTPANTTFPRINFWLRDGRRPSGIQTQLEVIIERVDFF
ncbi:glycoside hydrolase family 16 protein [Polyangium jinanense]|uniref:Glycoside hydrolase family 16 protein n=1 Tax=Polyangium jinanense TaxID=2829994 RepID=A0A9X3X8B6_9BACT|nr:glycoside hydrolase family 16 protein [Polyangium jinanense]MDC3955862.1 glycoside hydrolase family 16 protein [Polyangium jinanense]MDC3983221.1 glycoside hydrolase family 16 protein [Polyangium jinanense]